MKGYNTVKIEWTGIELDELVWKFSSDKIGWGSELIIKDNQAAAIFTKDKILSRGLKMRDYFGDVGSHIISIDSLPLVQKSYPDITRKRFLQASVIFCSTKEYLFCRKVYGGESIGQASAGCEAVALCRFRIVNPKLFLETFVAKHKKTNDSSLLGYIAKTLGIELFRRNRPYGWDSTKKTGIEDWQDLGIELQSLQFEHYKEGFAAVGV